MTYLSSSCGILGCTTCKQLCIAILDKLLVQRQVFLLGEDGVVGLEAILLEKSIVSVGQCVSNVESNRVVRVQLRELCRSCLAKALYVPLALDIEKWVLESKKFVGVLGCHFDKVETRFNV